MGRRVVDVVYPPVYGEAAIGFSPHQQKHISICHQGTDWPSNIATWTFPSIGLPWPSSKPIGSMYAIYGNIYHQYTPNVSIYTIHGPYGYGCLILDFTPIPPNILGTQHFEFDPIPTWFPGFRHSGQPPVKQSDMLPWHYRVHQKTHPGPQNEHESNSRALLEPWIGLGEFQAISCGIVWDVH